MLFMRGRGWCHGNKDGLGKGEETWPPVLVLLGSELRESPLWALVSSSVRRWAWSYALKAPSSANTQFSRAVCMQRLLEGVLRFPCDDELHFRPQWHRHQPTSFTSTFTSGWGLDRVIKEPNTAPILLTAPALSVTTYQPGTRTMVSSLLGCGFVLLPTRQASFLCRVQICLLTICYWKVGLLSSELLFSNDSLS